MMRKILWITTKLGFCTLVAAMLFVWQGGWWYVRPTHNWYRDNPEVDEPWRGCQFLAGGNRLVLFKFCDRDSTPPQISGGFEVVETETGKGLFGHFRDNYAIPSDMKYFFNGKETICFLDLKQKELTLFDLKEFTAKGPIPLPKNFPLSLWIGSFSEDSDTLYCGQQKGAFWKVNLATGNAQVTFTPKIEWGSIRADAKCAYATDLLHKSIFALDLTNGRTVWSHNVEPARVMDIRDDGIGQFVWYRLLHGISDDYGLLLSTTDRLVSRATGEEIYSTSWKDPDYDNHDVKTAADEELFAEVQNRSWSRPRFGNNASVLPLSPEFGRPASVIVTDPLGGRPPRRVQLSQAYKDCSARRLEIVDDNLFALQEYSTRQTDFVDTLRRSEWMPAFAVPYCTTLILALTGQDSGWPVLFDPNEPDKSRFVMVEPGGTWQIIPSRDGRGFATMNYNRNAAQTHFRIYYLPLRTWWGMRLVIAILPPLGGLFAVPWFWKRLRNRRTAKSNELPKVA